MAEPLTEIEKQVLRIAEAEARVARLKGRIDRLKAGGRPTEVYDALLATLQDNLALMQERLARLSAPVSYRCYLMVGERIHSVRVLQCVDDAEVVAQAAALLEELPGHFGIEIWQERRMVARVPKKAGSILP
jgi:uncharacterized small protein (DUF1192 family)